MICYEVKLKARVSQVATASFSVDAASVEEARAKALARVKADPGLWSTNVAHGGDYDLVDVIEVEPIVDYDEQA